MVQYEWLRRVMKETDLIQIVFYHPADARVGVGALVVRQTVLRETGQRYKPAVSSSSQPLEGKANPEKEDLTTIEEESFSLPFHR